MDFTDSEAAKHLIRTVISGQSLAGTRLFHPGRGWHNVCGIAFPKGGTPMERVTKSIDIQCPLRTVYNQWTQFEEFPRFMDGVKRVTQLDDQRLHWEAEIAGKHKAWNARIVDQVPDHRIAWESES